MIEGQQVISAAHQIIELTRTIRAQWNKDDEAEWETVACDFEAIIARAQEGAKAAWILARETDLS